MDPTFVPARVALAWTLKANRQYDEAIAEILRAYEDVGHASEKPASNVVAAGFGHRLKPLRQRVLMVLIASPTLLRATGARREDISDQMGEKRFSSGLHDTPMAVETMRQKRA